MRKEYSSPYEMMNRFFNNAFNSSDKSFIDFRRAKLDCKLNC